MAFVLDASAVLAVLLSDRPADETARIVRWLELDTPVVPAVFRPEVFNVLVKRERQTRGKSNRLEIQVRDLHDMAVVVDPDTARFLEIHTLPLARRHRMSIFDATYLELAMRRRLPLATFDKPLIAAAQAEQVPLLP